jgi:predicted CXXCH cytochrome family protein
MRDGQGTARILALVLAFGLAAGLASTAYASTESTYTAWTDPGFNHSEPHDTPHNGYGTTTTKCSVCHAVHKAPAAGEVLLRTTVGEACVYCHIDTNLGVIQIYNGDSSLYYIDNKKNHSLGGGVACTDCHAVHGANTYGTYLATKILKRLPIQPTFVRLFSATNDSNALYEAVGVDMGHMDEQNHMFPVGTLSWEDWNHVRQVQQTAFCTGCHTYYTRNDGTDPIQVGVLEQRGRGREPSRRLPGAGLHASLGHHGRADEHQRLLPLPRREPGRGPRPGPAGVELPALQRSPGALPDLELVAEQR